jgi:hypothetical protein
VSVGREREVVAQQRAVLEVVGQLDVELQQARFGPGRSIARRQERRRRDSAAAATVQASRALPPRARTAAGLAAGASVAADSSAMRASPMSRRPLPGIALEAAAQQRAQRGGRRRRQRRPIDLLAQDRGERVAHGLALEEALAAQHLEEHTPKAQTSARLSTARPRACSGDM